jgi:hypothetical protein
VLSAQTITMRLEAYLLQLTDVQKRWQRWLSSTLNAATNMDTDRLLVLQAEADTLGNELAEISQHRQQMLSEAQQSGWQARTLTSLAQRLPAWNRPKFRAAFSAARNQLEQLKRLHLATWVMLNQSAQHYQEMTMLLTLGTTQQDVYGMDYSKSRDGGGQLLDTSV